MGMELLFGIRELNDTIAFTACGLHVDWPAMPLKVRSKESVRKRRGDAPRRRDRQATWQRLVDAAIDLIRSHGIDALTTINVTQAAGIVQSGLYMHFRDLDDCKRAAAEQVATRIRRFVADHRHHSTTDASGTARHFEAVLSLYETERRFAELFVRCRHDASPVGIVMRQLWDQMRADLDADLRAQFGHLEPARIAIHAELILGMVVAAGEAILDGRITDAGLLSHELGAAVTGVAAAVLGHLPKGPAAESSNLPM